MTAEPAFAEVDETHEYPRLEDLGIVGDGRTAALIGREGTVWWLCAPRFDSPPIFCGLLDARRGGRFALAPEGALQARQSYQGDSGVLETEIRTREGQLRLTDFLALEDGVDLSASARAARGQLVRRARVVAGRVRLRVAIEPAGRSRVGVGAGRVVLHLPDHPCSRLQLSAAGPGLDGGAIEMGTGDALDLVLDLGTETASTESCSADRLEAQTLTAWRRWVAGLDCAGPHEGLVRRSAITLKMLDHIENGAFLAAPTSSLPEEVGGVRNWDYRYSWIRDAAFSVYALRRIGLMRESRAFLGWVLEAAARDGRPRVLYDVDGLAPPGEREDPALEGYRRSAPVRWGNAAYEQVQHDVHGEILDCAWQWFRHGGDFSRALARQLGELVDEAGRLWRTPDHGIWEVRSPGRPFTYSAAMCQVALDRGARMGPEAGLEGDARRWRASADEIRRAILDEAWVDELGAISEQLGGGGLDASVLALPLRRVLDASHPKMISTTRAIVDRLSPAEGLLYRYLPDESPDGLAGHEGAFLLCSFWLVDNLAAQGRLEQAHGLFDSLCARTSPLGLLPEQIDPSSGAFLGNFPQAFSHIGLVSSAVNLRRRT